MIFERCSKTILFPLQMPFDDDFGDEDSVDEMVSARLGATSGELAPGEPVFDPNCSDG